MKNVFKTVTNQELNEKYRACSIRFTLFSLSCVQVDRPKRAGHKRRRGSERPNMHIKTTGIRKKGGMKNHRVFCWGALGLVRLVCWFLCSTVRTLPHTSSRSRTPPCTWTVCRRLSRCATQDRARVRAPSTTLCRTLSRRHLTGEKGTLIPST